MALAYFITFSTYGTWLHHNEKGSVDRDHNFYGTPFLDSDDSAERLNKVVMVQSPYVMSAAEREIVCRAIVDLANEKGWDLLAVHVRTNHVHIVIGSDREPGRLMSDLKARASRDLTRAGFGDANRKRWTRHGSTKHLFRDEQVYEKISYTLDEQGERMAWYSKGPRTK